MDVHVPYRLTPEDIEAVRDSPSLGKDRALSEQEIADRPPHLGARIRWPDPAMSRRLRNWRVAFASGVRGFDRQLGEFIDVLRELEVLDDAVVVLASDHGEDLGPLVSGKDTPDEPWAFASALPEETATIVVQSEDLKLILDLETGDAELYDLTSDPGEQRDIASERDDLLGLMRQRVQLHLQAVGAFPSYRPTPTALSEEDIERLRSLGYVR